MASNTAFRIKGSMFPKSGLSDEGSEIRDRMESFYQDVYYHNELFWSEAYTDIRFYSGDNTVWDEVYGPRPYNKRQFSFNRIKRIINMISGYQRQHRKSIIVNPVENGDQITADQFTKVLMWMVRNDNILETVSDAFTGALTSGINLMQLWMDYSSDPISGDLRASNCSYNSFLLDPYFKKRDLSDCNSLWKRSYLTKNQIKALMPRDSDEDMLNYSDNVSGIDSYPGKFRYMPENWFNDAHTDKYNKLLSYDEFYYRDSRLQKILVDPQTGETMEWTLDNSKESNEKLKQFIQAYPEVKVVKQQVQTVKMAVVVDGNVIYDGANPLGTDTYPFIPVMGYFHPEMDMYYNRVQSVVRDLRDPQYLYNRRKNIELEMLEAQVNTGWKYKENALVDPKSVFLKGEGRGIALKKTAMMSDVEKIMPGQIPPTTMQLSESLGNEIMQISGVNEELLGSAQDDKAGILSMLRQGAGLTTLQGLFDNLDLSLKLIGKTAISLIQKNFSSAKVKKIIEEDPMPQFYNQAFGRYDASVEDGVNTSTQKQMQFQQLMYLKEAGIAIPDRMLIDTLTVQNKSELIQAIEEQNQQEQQMAMQQQQDVAQLQQAQANLANARAQADVGLAEERLSRVPENRALAIERIAQANENDENALYNKMRAIKELEEMDLNKLSKMIDVLAKMRITEKEQRMEEAKEVGVVGPEGVSSENPLKRASEAMRSQAEKMTNE